MAIGIVDAPHAELIPNEVQSGDTNNSEEQPTCSNQPVIAIGEQVQSKKLFTLEIPVLLLFFSWNLSGTVFQNQVLYQSCLLNYNSTICDLLTNEKIDEKLEEALESYASKIFMGRAVLESVVPAFISFFIGPWSDKYGRRPILLSTFTGYFLAYAILCAIAVASEYVVINPWFYLFAFIPLSLLGGTCALITGIFCYISDVSSEADRSPRMARMEAIVFVGLLFGSLSSGRLYKLTSASTVFGVATLCTLLALICVILFVQESIKNVTEETSRMAKLKALFEWRHVVDLFYTCFKRREHYNRILMWLIIFTLASAMFILEGSVAISYLFMREKFKWVITDYNLYSAFNVICQVAGNLIGPQILNKMLGMPDLVMAIVGYFSAMTEYIVTGLANCSWELYVASIVVMLKGVAVPMCRAHLASFVPSCEIGKVYSMTTSMESLSAIGAAPMYTIIYNYTLDTYPGAFNFFSALIYLYCCLLVLTVYLVRRRIQNAANYERFSS